MTIAHRHFRAPTEHGETIVVPGREEAGSLLANNAKTLNECDVSMGQRTLGQWREMAQRELLERAERYTRQYRDVSLESRQRQIILSGHQPQLFHAGVWYKNFVLSRLAETLDVVPINLVIDNDNCRSTSIQVPAGSPDSPRKKNIAYDRFAGVVPYETRPLRDLKTFESFGDEVGEAISPFVKEPLVATLWPEVVDSLNKTSSMSHAIAAGRHRFESRFGLQTLELPLGQICQTESFMAFALKLFSEAETFRDIHNTILAHYRDVHQIRSKTHPVPELTRVDDWVETPFWIWSKANRNRRRLYVEPGRDRITLLDFEGWQLTIDANDLAGTLAQLRQDGISIRTRALTTTLYSRLVLSDLFLHGIGGAKYDELTDVILEQWLGVERPAFLTVSATMKLPVDRPDVVADDVRRLAGHLRDLTYHPELHLNGGSDPRVVSLVRQKREALREIPPKGARAAWHQRIATANEGLQPFLDSKRERIRDEYRQTQHQLQIADVLGSREFSFCLFPESLGEQLLELAQ